MTDRDHFAAAALTGLLYPDVDDEFAMPYIVGRAYLWADAMLRERCRAGGDCPTPDNAPNHDAAPEARARTDADRGRTDKADSRPGEGAGDTPATHATPGECSEQRECTEPVAWAVMPSNSDYCVTLSTRKDCAQKAAEMKVEVGEYASMDDIVIVPLYRHPQPTLTDAERSLLEMLADHPVTHEIMPNEVATLRGLLERLGGAT